MSIFTLPDLGEGLPEAEIAQWFVQEGDTLALDQRMAAVETAKALVDIPSPQAGVVVKLFGAVGDIIHTGDPLLEFADESSSSTPKTVQRPDKGTVVGEMPVSQDVVKERPQVVGGGRAAVGVKATPAVRALAHRLQVELSIVTPSGPNGTIKGTDVERVAKILQDVGPLESLKGVRRAMAISMAKAHTEVVPVTLNDDADIEAWEAPQDVTLRLIRAMLRACRRVPALNAWYDSHSIGRRLIEAVHLGIAVDVDEGLFVPVIRHAQQLSDALLRDKINALKVALKHRRVPPEDLRGNTITLSNFGGMGGRYVNPIIVPPSVSILAAGSIRDEVVAVDRKMVIRRRIPLSLSFDHRAVTGGEACRFLLAVMQDLSQPV